jgi:ABC-2 type transport system ATP-binding protein
MSSCFFKNEIFSFIKKREPVIRREMIEMNCIEIKSLEKSFNGKKVLDGTDMTVFKSDIYGFLGPNGSGKTTTFRILSGVLLPDRGSVSVLGQDPTREGIHLRKRVNFLPESHGFYDWMYAEEYLYFYCQLYEVKLTAVDRCARLRQVGLDSGDKRPIRTFSRGMKQRLSLARSLLNDPEILFLDEPTNGLDPKGRRDIHDLLLHLNQEKGMTIVISTHILDDVERLCNRIAIINESKIRYEGPVLEESGKPMLYRFRVTDEKKITGDWRFPWISFQKKTGQWMECIIENGRPEDAIKLLIQHGIPVAEAVQVNSGLESIYMACTGERNLQ